MLETFQMLKVKNILGIICFFILCGCIGKKDISYNNLGKEIDTLAYFNVFTEATKHALIRNDKSAVKLYKESLKINPKSAASYYQMSHIYLRNNNIENAKKFAITAVELDSTNKWYNLHLSNIYQFTKQLDSAIYYYKKVVNQYPTEENLYNLALLYSSAGRNEEALLLIDKLQKENLTNRELILLRHNIFHLKNMPDSAINELEKLIKYYPEDYEGYGLLAEYLSELKRSNAARKVYRKLLELEPDNGLANVSYAEFLYNSGIKDSAFVYFKRGMNAADLIIDDKMNIIFNLIRNDERFNQSSLEIGELIKELQKNSSDVKILTLSADYNIKCKNYIKASTDLEKYTKRVNDNYLVWEQLIMINSYTEKHNNVISYSDSALKYFPEKGRLYIMKGYSQYELGRYSNLVKSAKTGLLKDNVKEDKIQLFNLLADAYRELELYDSSYYYYDEILKIDPENLMIRNNYGYYLSVRNERLDYAEELSRLTIRKEPNNATYLDTYGWILYKQGNLKEAKKFIEEAIRYGAYNNSEVLEHYGDIMYDMERCTEAIEAWEKALENDLENKRILEKINNASSKCK